LRVLVEKSEWIVKMGFVTSAKKESHFRGWGGCYISIKFVFMLYSSLNRWDFSTGQLNRKHIRIDQYTKTLFIVTDE